MSERCKEEVWNSFNAYRCSRKAVVDGYCKQHSPEAVKARREKGQKAFEERMEQSDWRQLALAKERIAALEEEKEMYKAGFGTLDEQNTKLHDRIAALEKDVQCWKNLCEFYKQWVIDAGMPIPEPPEAI